jgi:hypothetical protein
VRIAQLMYQSRIPARHVMKNGSILLDSKTSIATVEPNHHPIQWVTSSSFPRYTHTHRLGHEFLLSSLCLHYVHTITYSVTSWEMDKREISTV